jgi:hypothetical protein
MLHAAAYRLTSFHVYTALPAGKSPGSGLQTNNSGLDDVQVAVGSPFLGCSVVKVNVVVEGGGRSG